MRLFALAHDHHVLLINQHHIINDGWSLVILQRDLAALYDAALHGRPSDLADTPLQFAEFTVAAADIAEGHRDRAGSIGSNGWRGSRRSICPPTGHARRA